MNACLLWSTSFPFPWIGSSTGIIKTGAASTDYFDRWSLFLSIWICAFRFLFSTDAINQHCKSAIIETPSHVALLSLSMCFWPCSDWIKYSWVPGVISCFTSATLWFYYRPCRCFSPASSEETYRLNYLLFFSKLSTRLNILVQIQMSDFFYANDGSQCDHMTEWGKHESVEHTPCYKLAAPMGNFYWEMILFTDEMFPW